VPEQNTPSAPLQLDSVHSGESALPPNAQTHFANVKTGLSLAHLLDSDGQLSDITGMVSFVSTRELSKQPGKVMRKARDEGTQIITQNGVPAAYLIPASNHGIEVDLDTLRRAFLGRSLDALQAEAARNGTTKMTEAEIAAEISTARSVKTKRTRKQQTA
jgi:prevent-host-death family protein